MNKVKNLKVYKECLIVVDMVNGFVRDGVLHDKKIADVIPRQEEIIKEYQEKGELVIFIKDTHHEKSKEFKRFGNTYHCLKGTYESEIVDELKPYEEMANTISVEKNSTSFMEAPKFREVIEDATNIERFDIVGCCTDICDFNGAMGLANYCDQWDRDVEIYVHQDAVATYGIPDRQHYVDAAYLLMEQQGIKLVKKI